MNRRGCESLYRRGRTPAIEQLEGTWKVRMWGWYRIMRLDRKVIKGNRGYNVFLCFRWGKFTVRQLDDALELRYDKGGIVDYLRLHPDRDDVMLGEFYRKGNYDGPFALAS